LIIERVVNPKVRFGIKPEKKGAIVLMHPKPNTVQALPIILTKLKQEGFGFVTMEELVSLRVDN
jgi:peptidoglycan/xylan/chitin deacetylase (PgdA/CDA1 family)